MSNDKESMTMDGISMDSVTPLLLIGGGNMGTAMLEGWLASGMSADEVWVIDPSEKAASHLRDTLNVNVCPDMQALPSDFVAKTVILAVKPQMLPVVMPEISDLPKQGVLYLSIAAGKTIAFFEDYLVEDVNAPRPAVVRAMPNTPASIGEGMTALCANAAVSEQQRQVAAYLVSSVGTMLWIDDESQMDAVTALSGSGPAYIFAMIEAMTQAGTSVGLPNDVAEALATQTVKGAGLLAAQSGKNAGQLRREVTSPNGTTAAALDTLLDPADGLLPLVSRAIAAANRRSRELAG